MSDFQYRFSNFTTGSTDNDGRIISEVKRLVEEKYIFYFVEGNYLEVFSDVANNYPLDLSSDFTSKIAEVDGWVIGNNMKNKKLSFVREGFSNAYIAEFDGHTTSAIQHLESLIDKIKNYHLQKFMLGSGLPVIFMSICSILIYYFNFFQNKMHIRNMCYCIGFSSIGSLFYHFMKYFYKKDFNHDIGIISGVLSFFKASISGVLIYIFIKSNLILGIASENIFVILALSLVSGFNDDIPVKLIMKLTDVFKLSGEQ